MRVFDLLRRKLLAADRASDPVQRFQDEYPLSLPGRLEFLEEALNLPRERILSLAGAPTAFARDPAVRSQTWEDLLAQQAAEHYARLAAVEEAIVGYLDDVNYDLATAAAVLTSLE